MNEQLSPRNLFGPRMSGRVDIRAAPLFGGQKRPANAPPGWAPEGTVRAGDPGTQKTPAPLPKGRQPFNAATLIYMMTRLAPQQNAWRSRPRTGV